MCWGVSEHDWCVMGWWAEQQCALALEGHCQALRVTCRAGV